MQHVQQLRWLLLLDCDVSSSSKGRGSPRYCHHHEQLKLQAQEELQVQVQEVVMMPMASQWPKYVVPRDLWLHLRGKLKTL